MQPSISASVTPPTPDWTPQLLDCFPTVPASPALTPPPWQRRVTSGVSASLGFQDAISMCTQRGYRGPISWIYWISRCMEIQLWRHVSNSIPCATKQIHPWFVRVNRVNETKQQVQPDSQAYMFARSSFLNYWMWFSIILVVVAIYLH